MKSITNYINEAYEEYRLNSLDVKYFCYPDEIIIQAPATFQESDIQEYLDNLLLPDMPASFEYADNFFGKNADNIYDEYFEYDSFEHLPENYEPKEVTFEWNAKHGTNSQNNEDLHYFKIKNMKYVINFDRFDLLDANDDNIKDTLLQIFSATESNKINKYPIEIKLDKNIEYKK